MIISWLLTLILFTLGYYYSSPLMEVKLGVLYGIYLLYFTQPDNFEKIRIRVSLSAPLFINFILFVDFLFVDSMYSIRFNMSIVPEIFRSLARLHKYCQENDMFDAEYVHERLIAENAFELVAVVDPCGEYGRDIHNKKK